MKLYLKASCFNSVNKPKIIIISIIIFIKTPFNVCLSNFHNSLIRRITIQVKLVIEPTFYLPCNHWALGP